MRKNKMMRLASVILVLTLLSTCAISGTFAKYTTKAKASDTARVAKWGVVVTTSGTLYSDAYIAVGSGTDGNVPSVGAEGETITVNIEKDGKDNLVAPGTKSAGDGLTFSITGTPEVATKITGTLTAKDIFLKSGYTYAVMSELTVTADDFDKLDLYTKGDSDKTYTAVNETDTYDSTKTYYILNDEVNVTSDYYPVKYSISQNDKAIQEATDIKATEVMAGLAWSLSNDASISSTPDEKGVSTWDLSNSNVFAPNTDLGNDKINDSMYTAGLKDINVSWVWDFDDNGQGTYDGQDTILGNLIAGFGDNPTSYVVYKVDNGSYTDAAIDTTNKIVKTQGENATVIAHLATELSIDITISQVD